MVEQTLLLISYMLIFGVSLMIVAIGGVFSERSGVINIGLEGIMCVGGLAGLLVIKNFADTGMSPFLLVLLTILAGVIAGILYSMLLAVVCIKFKANQTLIGTALNLLATALTIIIAKRTSAGSSTSFQYTNDAFIFYVFGLKLNVFIILGIFVLILSFITLYKTRFGLRLRACGENPAACDSVGINVVFYRYMGVGISGALAGLGALCYMIPTSSFFNASNGVAGFGFLALAVMIFGAWKVGRIAVVALFFSFFMALSYLYYGIFDAFFDIQLTADKGVTSELFKMIPYIVSLILLAFTSKNSRAPKAEGIPYDKSSR